MRKILDNAERAILIGDYETANSLLSQYYRNRKTFDLDPEAKFLSEHASNEGPNINFVTNDNDY
jgi:hypothetical protein